MLEETVELCLLELLLEAREEELELCAMMEVGFERSESLLELLELLEVRIWVLPSMLCMLEDALELELLEMTLHS